jgi:hypothetical protein
MIAMRRLLLVVLGPTLLLAPSLALAHDPLDDVSGEEDLNKPGGDAEKPRSHKKERQEQDLAKEVQEHEETEFHVTSEKEEFLRDRTDTKEVKGGQMRRSQLSGGGARGHRSGPEHPAAKHSTAGTSEAAPEAEPESAAPQPQRGDVDPTDTSMDTTAKPKIEGNPDAPPPPAPRKKKRK